MSRRPKDTRRALGVGDVVSFVCFVCSALGAEVDDHAFASFAATWAAADWLIDQKLDSNPAQAIVLSLLAMQRNQQKTHLYNPFGVKGETAEAINGKIKRFAPKLDLTPVTIGFGELWQNQGQTNRSTDIQ
jgi:hypothetical protein